MADHRTPVLVVEHILSFAHAKQILTKFKIKKHASAGYFFELTDLGMNIWSRRIDVLFSHLRKANHDNLVPRFGDYGGDVQGWHLKVWRDKA